MHFCSRTLNMCVSSCVVKSFSVVSIPARRPAMVDTVNHAGSTVSLYMLCCFLSLIMVASLVWLFGKDRFVLMVKVVSMVCIVSNLQVMKSLPVIVVLRLSIPLSLVAPALLPAPTPVPGCTPAHILSITTAIVISSVPSVPFSQRRCAWEDMRCGVFQIQYM